MMDVDAQRKVVSILKILASSDTPMGSRHIAAELGRRGMTLSERMVRYYLEQMDRLGFTTNEGKKGRTITEKGREELESALAQERVGSISVRVDEMAYRLSFDPTKGEGTVILNMSLVREEDAERAIEIVETVLRTDMAMGGFLCTAPGGGRMGTIDVPEGMVGIGTLCSVTLNGVFFSRGIPMRSQFGGLLEFREYKPVRFTQIIYYEGTTIDPIEIFIKGHMTSVWSAVKTGNGTVGASFREIPAAALPEALHIIEDLKAAGMGGVLTVGIPGQPVLDIPVAAGRVGIVVAAGMNPIAAVEEHGIPTRNEAMSSLVEFSVFNAV